MNQVAYDRNSEFLDRTSTEFGAILAREQELINFYGGAQTDRRRNASGALVAGTSGNPQRAIGQRNGNAAAYWAARASYSGPPHNWGAILRDNHPANR